MLGYDRSQVCVPMESRYLNCLIALEILYIKVYAQFHKVDSHVTLVAASGPMQRCPLQSVLMIQFCSILVQEFNTLLKPVECGISGRRPSILSTKA